MIKDIKYNGYTAQPSDYECADGDLSAVVNLVPEDGAVKPISKPKVIRNIGMGNSVLCIHHTVGPVNYIIYNTSSHQLSYVAENSTDEPQPIDELYNSYYNISHINAVGNTLIVFTPHGMYYYLWKNGGYDYLGDHIPEVDISFGLIGRARLFSKSDESKSTFTITFKDIPLKGLFEKFSDENQTTITEQVMARVNKFIRQQTVEKGRFCFPFFVRYALRLFDGSLVNHSAPILMNPSTTTCPVVMCNRFDGKDTATAVNSAEMDIMLVAASLDYSLVTSTDMLEDWKDIVKGVEIFISKPVYTFEQSGKCTSFSETGKFTSKFIGRLFANNRNTLAWDRWREDEVYGPFESKDFLDIYAEWGYDKIYAIYFSLDRKYPNASLNLSEFTEDKVSESLRDTATFYKLTTIDTEDICTKIIGQRYDITVKDDYLQSLVTRETLADDYLTHDTLASEYSYGFNNRLNLSGVYRKPYRGFFPQNMWAYCNNYYSWKVTEQTLCITPFPVSGTYTTISVYINEGGREYVVLADKDESNVMRFLSHEETDEDGKKFLTKHSWGCYVFYPNVNAHKMLISNVGIGSFLITLKPHEFLNGAYALLDYEQVREVNYNPDDLPQVDVGPIFSIRADYIPQPNKIFTSEVNNPFFFPLSGINSVGTGKILAICSAAKALSQGQFGQFPLYAFTDEGVWAMEISSTGTYIAKQPITRDVCINPDGITQIDSSVLFPTDRGIMLISGSQTQCITDTIKTEKPFNLLSLPHIKELHDRLNHNPAIDKCLPILPFTEFLKSCRMIYDYVHQRIIVYNAAVTYAYVYSLKSQMWGMIYSNISDNVNSYPNALAVDTERNLVDFSITEDADVASMLVSRPIKLETPDVLKTIDTVIQRGHFQKGHVQSVLYGSRDLYNWHLVWSSKDHYLRGFRGTPYKYFRIALLCNLYPDESIFGASLQFTPRLTNQTR